MKNYNVNVECTFSGMILSVSGAEPTLKEAIRY